MAFLGQFLPKQPKCWCNLSLSLTSVAAQRFNRLFSSQTVENSNIDTPLIQEATIGSESEAKGSEFRTFEELFKKSAFVSLGNPKGKIVLGTIKKVVEDSLYIDFGWKFYCVCPKPSQGSGSYVAGKKVRLMIKDLELATKFLGSNVEVTLNEANCVLLGLHIPPSDRRASWSESISEEPLTSDPLVSDSEKKVESVVELFADENKSIEEREAKEKGTE